MPSNRHDATGSIIMEEGMQEMWLYGKVFLHNVSVVVYECVQYVCVYANLYACARRGVVVLRSMHTCGFNTFFRPHRR